MGKLRVTPWTTAVALIQASQDADTAARAVRVHQPGSHATDAEEATEKLAVSLALAIVRMGQLRQQDRRADYGVVYQMLLEYLPALLVPDHPTVPTSLALVALQLNALAADVLALDGTTPKPLDIAGAIAATDAEILREAAPDIVAALRADLARDFPATDAERAAARKASLDSVHDSITRREPHMVRVAGSPLPLACPRGHQPRHLARLPKEIAGDVLDAISCDACPASYVLLPAGWLEAPR